MGTAESSVIERADADLVLQEINQLPLAFREVLLLCDVEEMSYKEIPEVLREGLAVTTSYCAGQSGQ